MNESWDLVLKPENLEKLKAAASLSLMRLKKFLPQCWAYLGKDRIAAKRMSYTGPATRLLLSYGQTFAISTPRNTLTIWLTACCNGQPSAGAGDVWQTANRAKRRKWRQCLFSSEVPKRGNGVLMCFIPCRLT
ncbi:hypothetical protein KCP76_18590 [Salmonella enterica subsp. enterica serovar Weltevreden]|nr:hypothetical protein KCP76_18590 [Salmonella enterica subsp. enterica serovar Weltevreden]